MGVYWMFKGTVKNFNVKLGFGFITRDKFNDDIFVYLTAFDHTKIRNLHPGQRVSFNLCNDRGKKMACRVERIIEKDDD